MTRHRLDKIEVARPRVLRLTFSDGLAGELDLSSFIEKGPYFAPLADADFFRDVRIAADGRSFGWRLDQLGDEIDFGVEGARADIETTLVEERADRFRRHLAAAAE